MCSDYLDIARQRSVTRGNFWPLPGGKDLPLARERTATVELYFRPILASFLARHRLRVDACECQVA
jgi:hypothetical protein